MDGLVIDRKIGYYCFPPMDPVTGAVSAEDDAIFASERRHCDLPGRHKRQDCQELMRYHYYISNNTYEGVVLCPQGLFVPGPIPDMELSA